MSQECRILRVDLETLIDVMQRKENWDEDQMRLAEPKKLENDLTA